LPASQHGGPGSIPSQSIEICGGQRNTGTGASASKLLFPLSVSFQQRCSLIFVCMLLLPEGQTGEPWKLSKKQCPFGNLIAADRKLFLFCLVFTACCCSRVSQCGSVLYVATGCAWCVVQIAVSCAVLHRTQQCTARNLILLDRKRRYQISAYLHTL